jgi:hypothetical protein
MNLVAWYIIGIRALEHIGISMPLIIEAVIGGVTIVMKGSVQMVYLDYDPYDEYETGTYVEFPSDPPIEEGNDDEEREVINDCAE